MIVETGKNVRIDSGVWKIQVLRSCTTPGVVTLQKGNASFELPANVDEAERFIAAYRRAIAEDVPYREQVVE